ncbi:sn-glycerol-3-phosphate ABC transporter ATP-binding protein UgpC [Mesorhizobium sp. M2C.T.Ca.TU.002.02.1.1]|uniref:ABC transporter ATP-binding protein n=1 Tax=Mesorhizobium sp. M2C.T.Ca.TU.002.02.1.1 TaxID=2496788 RepID=UPI000FCCA02D|nr:sn-glycerol-3-phosphate ABC transporter ATP-binding protein UgpC [Mesorhizobium sp. M2C.T.Ca.TU.002.02.1.1]RUU61533.1 sn-glycerol-3-phosphate ABC transporter ATP-binding protein UgpC [Mesorhizobium sp. M2C.T.Ca.TU.002.02.1.1]RUU71905.1 sn-glycerol-3-phosphate ABC transporter ATP-binding protein UgpC [Mesorhizobium sp. M2C.T.Ca.TU.009.01.2.1]
MSSVTLRKVVKRYGQIEVVHGIDLAVEEGEFVVLLGPSGCGKTTTLRMVAGLEDISGGQLEIAGRVVNDLAPKDRQIAMVFQNYALYPHMTVRQNMEFALKPQKLPGSEVSARIAEAARILGLEPLLERKPAQLSGGQRQRVAMARAMVRTPKVFLFDEPLSNLDAKLRTQVRVEIAKLHKRLGTTVLYVTHDQVEAMTLADKIVIMKDGHIEQVGSPEDVFAKPRNLFVATFIGSPAMNLLPAKVEADNGAPVLVANGFRMTAPASIVRALNPGASITVGIRPNDIRVDDETGEYEAVIEVDEYLGTEALLNLRAGDHELVAQVPAAARPAPDRQSVRIGFDTARLHVFDTQSGEAIR